MADKESDLCKTMLAADERENSLFQERCHDLVVNSGLRFHEGIRSVFRIVEMLESRINAALERSKMLQALSCRWTKKLASIALLGDGDFDHGTMYSATTRLLLEPVEEAKIHNRLRNEIMDLDGPLEILRMWLSEMTESTVPHDALQLYYQADKKQKRIEEEIGLAMTKYHYRMYKLGRIRQFLENHPILIPAATKVELRRRHALYSEKADRSKQKYLGLLSQEREDRESYLEDVRESKRQFDWFEKRRLLVLKRALTKYFTIMKIIDLQRAEHMKISTEIRDTLARMDVNEEVANLIEKFRIKIPFPVYKEFDESIFNSRREHVPPSTNKEATLPRKKVLLKKKGGQIKPCPETSGSDDVRKTMLSVDDNSGCLYPDDSDDRDFKTAFCVERGEVSTIKSNPGQPQQQEKPKTKDSGIDTLERESTTTIFSRKAFSKNKTEQGEVAEFMPESTDAVDNSEVPSPAEVTTLANIKVVAAQSYQGQAVTELSFRQGQNIKQKMPANSKGMAYGWTKSSKFSRKQYGFYPASLVQLKPKKHSARGGAELISVNSDSDDGSNSPSPADISTWANVKVVAVESYQAQTADELSLRKGQSIKQRLPANSSGMSFGWTKASKFSRKQYGFYPASIVQLKPKKTGIRSLLYQKSAPLIFN